MPSASNVFKKQLFHSVQRNALNTNEDKIVNKNSMIKADLRNSKNVKGK